MRGFFIFQQSLYFFSSVFRKPENFFWKRDTRPPRSRICCWPPVQAGCDLGQEAGEFLLEAGHAAAAIEDLLLASGPGRMRFGVDVEVQDVTFLAPCGARGELAAVRHHDLNGVIAGMDILFHFFDSGRSKGADMPNLALLYRSQPKAASGCN